MLNCTEYLSVHRGTAFSHEPKAPAFGSNHASQAPVSVASQGAQAPRFGFANAVNLVSNSVGKLENRFLELFVTDIMGMVLPRTALEWKQRGPDAGRENAIREFSGNFSLMFSMGFFTFLLLRLLNDRVSVANPLGVNQRSYVDREALKAFETIYRQTLENPALHSRKQVEIAFLTNVFEALRDVGMDSGDAMQKQALELAGASQALTGKSVPVYTGQLSQEAVKDLRDALLLRSSLSKSVGQPKARLGYQDLDAGLPAKIDNWLALAEGKTPGRITRWMSALQGRLGLTSGLSAQEARYAQLRLAQSLLAKGSQYEKDVISAIDQIALNGGLRHDVMLVHPETGATLLRARNRKVFFRQLKGLMEEVIGRAHANVTESAWQNGAWKQHVEHQLFNQPQSQNWLTRWLPKADDGLFRYLVKSKMFSLKIPLVATIVTAVSVAFINNWITRRKSGGVDYFPGEGLHPTVHANAKTGVSGAQPAQHLLTSAVPRTAPFSSRYGLFESMRQQRHPRRSRAEATAEQSFKQGGRLA